MSTAGKVLTVLVTLVALVWLLLAAGVTQLNRNGTKAVDALNKQVAQLDEQITKARTDLQKLIDSAKNEQHDMQNALTELQARQSGVEGELARSRETAARVKYQLETTSAALEQAKAGRDIRVAEKEAETKAKADAEAEVERLKAQNKESRDQLDALREKFRQSLRANKEMVDKLRGARPSGSSRAASFVR
jgi:chromosome segregation ATPase